MLRQYKYSKPPLTVISHSKHISCNFVIKSDNINTSIRVYNTYILSISSFSSNAPGKSRLFPSTRTGMAEI